MVVEFTGCRNANLSPQLLPHQSENLVVDGNFGILVVVGQNYRSVKGVACVVGGTQVIELSRRKTAQTINAYGNT